jgi:hypothetical protein
MFGLNRDATGPSDSPNTVYAAIPFSPSVVLVFRVPFLKSPRYPHFYPEKAPWLRIFCCFV